LELVAYPLIARVSRDNLFYMSGFECVKDFNTNEQSYVSAVLKLKRTYTEYTENYFWKGARSEDSKIWHKLVLEYAFVTVQTGIILDLSSPRLELYSFGQ
jgi:hypothetical protein